MFQNAASIPETKRKMKNETYLHIAEPCHENWNNMSAADQGKYCGSCCKTVTDFSMMSDKEILAVLSKAPSNTCGRFTKDQLERPLYEQTPTHSKPYRFFLSALIPTFLLANTGMAQTKGSTAKPRSTTEKTMGKIARVDCKVGEPKVETVKANHFEIGEVAVDTSIKSFGGVKTDNQKPANDELPLSTDNIMMGGIQIYEPVTFVDTVKTYVRKTFNQNGFKIVGNPAASGTFINLQFKNEGTYTVQLLDASGKIVSTQKVFVNGRNGLAKINLASNFIPGIYFVKVTDETKKTYTDKVSIY